MEEWPKLPNFVEKTIKTVFDFGQYRIWKVFQLTYENCIFFQMGVFH